MRLFFQMVVDKTIMHNTANLYPFLGKRLVVSAMLEMMMPTVFTPQRQNKKNLTSLGTSNCGSAWW